MGDRTSTLTTISASDLPRVRELLLGSRDHPFVDETMSEGGLLLTVEQHDVSYGGDMDAQALMAAGIPFLIHHGAGGSYGEGLTASDGADVESIAALGDQIVLTYDEQMDEASLADLGQARKFVRLRDAALEAMRQRSREAMKQTEATIAADRIRRREMEDALRGMGR